MILLLKCPKLLIKFSIYSHYNLRYTFQFSVNPVHGVYNGTESASYFGPKIWEQIPCEIRYKKFFAGFKWEIKKPTECPIVSLIIHISWLLILRIHLLKKTLPVSSIRHPKIQSFRISEHSLTSCSCVSGFHHEAVLST